MQEVEQKMVEEMQRLRKVRRPARASRPLPAMLWGCRAAVPLCWHGQRRGAPDWRPPCC